MKAKKFLSLALACLMLCTCLIACGKKDKNGDGDGTASTTNGENVDYLKDIPIVDFGGKEFVILEQSRGWAAANMTASEYNAEVINDAIYTRTLSIKERLNVTLKDEMVGSPRSTALPKIQGGDTTYGLIIMNPHDCLSLYQEGLSANQSTVSTINFNNPWWEKNLMDNINIGNKTYVSYSNANLVYYSGLYIYAFNKSLIESNGLENPYDMVDAGTWTWDAVYEMMKKATVSTGEDGVASVANGDTVGLVGHVNHIQNLIGSSGYTIIGTDATGNLVWNGAPSDNYFSAFEKYTRYFINAPEARISGMKQSHFEGYSNSSGLANYVSYFNDGKALFLTTGTSEIAKLAQSNVEYGIVVCPKADENQDHYVTPVYCNSDGFCIPTGNRTQEDIDNTGIILETLGALSYKNLVDIHIGTVLHSRAANDATARRMITKAYESGQIDLALANNFGNCADVTLNLNSTGKTEVSSAFARINKQIGSDIRNALKD